MTATHRIPFTALASAVFLLLSTIALGADRTEPPDNACYLQFADDATVVEHARDGNPAAIKQVLLRYQDSLGEEIKPDLLADNNSAPLTDALDSAAERDAIPTFQSKTQFGAWLKLFVHDFNEAFLLDRAKQGDASALHQIILNYDDYITRSIGRKLAEKAIGKHQDESVKSLVERRLETSVRNGTFFNGRGGCAFSTWLNTVVENAFRDWFRSHSKQVRLVPYSSEDVIASGMECEATDFRLCSNSGAFRRTPSGESQFIPGDVEVEVLGRLDEERRRKAVCQAIEQMGPKYEATYVHVYVQGLTHAKTAGLLGEPESTVSTRVSELQKRLRALHESGDLLL